MADLKAIIESGKTALGIEFGSTRIKAVLIDESFKPIASGSYSWENQLIDGFWTYSLDDIWKGLRDCYKSLVADVKEIRCRADQDRQHRFQCHDAWLYGL